MSTMAKRSTIITLLILCCMAPGCRKVNPQLAAGIRQGDRNYRQGNLIGAEKVLTDAIAADSRSPASAEAYYIRGLTRLKRGDNRGAEADFFCAVQLARRTDLKTSCRVCLGSIAYQRENYRRAYEHYRAAADDLPQVSPSDRVVYRLAVSAQKIGKWRDARKYFGKVIREYPRAGSARLARKLVGYDCFTIQAGAFRKRTGANSRLSRLKRAGLDARVEVKSNSGSTVRVIYVGRYKDFNSAVGSLGKIKRIVPGALIVP